MEQLDQVRGHTVEDPESESQHHTGLQLSLDVLVGDALSDDIHNRLVKDLPCGRKHVNLCGYYTSIKPREFIGSNKQARPTWCQSSLQCRKRFDEA